ncbi:hypothetical protein [Sediminibacterium goheungense]|uniref:Uncharacterized protein n=1 Tax=Sediminibacterium goheungense TaxID=1086393 RepID=A0A4R6IVQ6_9BACT|nr:hypothetical protein [Sediminibacterium goheungense]TDO26744.1 hypothetical protein BC659_2054 [Sediminibacterium goheungense]
MKQIIVILTMLFAGQLMAQTKYESGMQKGLEQFAAAKSAEDMAAASAFFERIADAEKDKWLPYYYAAYTNHLTGWMNPKADKDKVAEKSKDLLGKAEALEKNADTYCMRQMIAIQQLTVDGMSRYQTYGAIAAQAIEDAKKADANNPRIYLVEAQYMINVPAAFGGGKAVAKKLVEKSLELYGTYKPASPFHPQWGKDQATQLLAACQ